MEKSVNGIREIFFRDLKRGYREQQEKSFLYRAFWADGVKELLRRNLPPLPRTGELKALLKRLKSEFLEPLADERNGPELLQEHYERLPGEVKELLRNHLPQLPEEVRDRLGQHYGRLPEEVKGLLDERFPWLREEEIFWPRYERQIRELLKESMQKRPQWARDMLQREAPGENVKERRDFWEELWLRDAGYEAGLLSDMEYYLWLLEYLAARDIYYNTYYYYNDNKKDEVMDGSIKEDGREWLRELLQAVTRDTEPSGRAHAGRQEAQRWPVLQGAGEDASDSIPDRESVGEEGASDSISGRESAGEEAVSDSISGRENVGEEGASDSISGRESVGEKVASESSLSVKKVRERLTELAERIRSAQSGSGDSTADAAFGAKIVRRLQGLEHRGEKGRKTPYLPWLTANLKRRALHIRIKNWLQDSGYPLAKEGETNRRKQDFSMWLFEAYCGSEEGYSFGRKREAGTGGAEGWKVENGFCVWRPEDFESSLNELLEALRQSGQKWFYLPLAVDLHSGCVFFLAGKEHYEDVYRTPKLREKYNRSEEFYCFDYLRLDSGYEMSSGVVGEAFRLWPTFHENAGRSYRSVLDDFKRYCEDGSRDDRGAYHNDPYSVPRQAIKEINHSERHIDIPQIFCRAFGQEKRKPTGALSRKQTGTGWGFEWKQTGAGLSAADDFRQTQKKIEKGWRPAG